MVALGSVKGDFHLHLESCDPEVDHQTIRPVRENTFGVVDSSAAESVFVCDWVFEFTHHQGGGADNKGTAGVRMEHYGEKVCDDLAGLSTTVKMWFWIGDARDILA